MAIYRIALLAWLAFVAAAAPDDDNLEENMEDMFPDAGVDVAGDSQSAAAPTPQTGLVQKPPAHKTGTPQAVWPPAGQHRSTKALRGAVRPAIPVVATFAANATEVKASVPVVATVAANATEVKASVNVSVDTSVTVSVDTSGNASQDASVNTSVDVVANTSVDVVANTSVDVVANTTLNTSANGSANVSMNSTANATNTTKDDIPEKEIEQLPMADVLDVTDDVLDGNSSDSPTDANASVVSTVVVACTDAANASSNDTSNTTSCANLTTNTTTQSVVAAVSKIEQTVVAAVSKIENMTVGAAESVNVTNLTVVAAVTNSSSNTTNKDAANTSEIEQSVDQQENKTMVNNKTGTENKTMVNNKTVASLLSEATQPAVAAAKPAVAAAKPAVAAAKPAVAAAPATEHVKAAPQKVAPPTKQPAPVAAKKTQVVADVPQAAAVKAPQPVQGDVGVGAVSPHFAPQRTPIDEEAVVYDEDGNVQINPFNSPSQATQTQSVAQAQAPAQAQDSQPVQAQTQAPQPVQASADTPAADSPAADAQPADSQLAATPPAQEPQSGIGWLFSFFGWGSSAATAPPAPVAKAVAPAVADSKLEFPKRDEELTQRATRSDFNHIVALQDTWSHYETQDESEQSMEQHKESAARAQAAEREAPRMPTPEEVEERKQTHISGFFAALEREDAGIEETLQGDGDGESSTRYVALTKAQAEQVAQAVLELHHEKSLTKQATARQQPRFDVQSAIHDPWAQLEAHDTADEDEVERNPDLKLLQTGHAAHVTRGKV